MTVKLKPAILFGLGLVYLLAHTSQHIFLLHFSVSSALLAIARKWTVFSNQNGSHKNSTALETTLELLRQSFPLHSFEWNEKTGKIIQNRATSFRFILYLETLFHGI